MILFKINKLKGDFFFRLHIHKLSNSCLVCDDAVDVSSVKFKKKSWGSYFLIGIKVKLEGRLGSMQLATDIKSGMSFRSTPTKEMKYVFTEFREKLFMIHE